MPGQERTDASARWTPTPDGEVRDPEAVADESAPAGASADEQYW